MRRGWALLAAGLLLAGCAGSGTPTSTPAPGSTRSAAASPTPATTPAAEPTAPPAPPSHSPTGLPPASAGRDWTVLPTTDRVVALTFDAGANADGVPAILAALRRAKAPGTFFLTGAWVRSYPEAAREIAAAYPIGNHSMTHPHLPALTDAQVRAQVRDAAEAIDAVTGRPPAALFRFPFGDVTDHDLGLVNGLGYASVRWTVDSLGWLGTSRGGTADTVASRVLGALRPGAIVLMHVGSNPDDHTTFDAAALPRIIEGIRAAGYRLVTVPAYLR